MKQQRSNKMNTSNVTAINTVETIDVKVRTRRPAIERLKVLADKFRTSLELSDKHFTKFEKLAKSIQGDNVDVIEACQGIKTTIYFSDCFNGICPKFVKFI